MFKPLGNITAEYAGLRPAVGFEFIETAAFTAARLKSGSMRSQVVRRQFAAFQQSKNQRAQGCCMVLGTQYLCRWAGNDKNGAGFCYIYNMETHAVVGCYITLAERYAVVPEYLPIPKI